MPLAKLSHRLARNSDEALRRIQLRFRKIHERHDRAIKTRRQSHRALLPLAGVAAISLLYFGLIGTFPRLHASVMDQILNIATTSNLTGTTYYRNCDAARAAGAAPIMRGEPGYRPPLDRDNDGIACEPWSGR